VVSTRVIGYNAYKIFVKGELPTVEEIEKDIPIEGEVVESKIDDIDTRTLESAIKTNISSEDIKD
jgi:hypothetical protein